MEEKKRPRLDYKWVVIGLCFMMVLVALGFCSSPRSLMINPISKALGIPKSIYSITDSCRYVTTAVVNVFFGFLVMRFGPKKLILAGFTSLIASALLFSFADHFLVLYLGGIFLGMGLSWTTTTMVGYVVTRWCKENKGTIMGAVLASNGIGGAIAIQIMRPMIAESAEGYRKAYLFVAAVLAVVAVIILIFFRNAPKGAADPEPVSHKKKKRGADWVGISFGEAVKKKYFWGMLICVFLTGFMLQGVNGVTAAHYENVGIDFDMVTYILSFHSLVLACSKFLTGFSYDRIGLRATATICMTTALISSICLVMIDPSPFGIALAFFNSTISCFALPLETIMLPIYANDLFGSKSFDKVLGIFVSVNTAGYALGAPTLNLCRDLTGSYNVGFVISIFVMLAIMITFQFVLSASRRERAAILAEEEAAVSTDSTTGAAEA